MNKLHRQAIELKYQGLTHEEISQALGQKLTKKTIDTYFSQTGLLYFQYVEFETNQNQASLSVGRSIFQKEAGLAAKTIVSTLQKAQKAGKHAIVLKAAETILDRAGINSVNKPGVPEKNSEEPKTYEEFVASYKEKGFDLATGIAIRAIQILSIEEKAEMIKESFEEWSKNGILTEDQEIIVTIRQKDSMINDQQQTPVLS